MYTCISRDFTQSNNNFSLHCGTCSYTYKVYLSLFISRFPWRTTATIGLPIKHKLKITNMKLLPYEDDKHVRNAYIHRLFHHFLLLDPVAVLLIPSESPYVHVAAHEVDDAQVVHDDIAIIKKVCDSHYRKRIISTCGGPS